VDDRARWRSAPVGNARSPAAKLSATPDLALEEIAGGLEVACGARSGACRTRPGSGGAGERPRMCEEAEKPVARTRRRRGSRRAGTHRRMAAGWRAMPSAVRVGDSDIGRGGVSRGGEGDEGIRVSFGGYPV
jgi:hypothetical protein